MKKLVTRCILTYLRFFARLALAAKRPVVVGITGSVGKTSARDAIYAVLKDSHKTHVIRKGNSETGIPLGILGLEVHSIGFDSIHKSLKDWARLIFMAPFRLGFPGRFEYMIIEMGIDEPHPPKNMSYLLSIVEPDVSVVLNAYPVHAQQFESVVEGPITERAIVEAIAREKCKIVTTNRRCILAIYNADNRAVADILDATSVAHMPFGTSEDEHVSYDTHHVTLSGTEYTFHIRGEKLNVNIDGFVLPEVYREVIAAAVCVGIHAGMSLKDIAGSLQKNFTIQPGRCSVLAGVHGAAIIDSSYNASREAVRAMLELAFTLRKGTHRPLVFVFGDMRELGKSAQREHEAIAEMLAGQVDYLYTVGPLTKKYVYEKLKDVKGFREVAAFDGPHEVGKHLKQSLPKGALVLFKGSQNTIFLEEAIKYVLANSADAKALARQEDYWMRKKQFSLSRGAY